MWPTGNGSGFYGQQPPQQPYATPQYPPQFNPYAMQQPPVAVPPPRVEVKAKSNPVDALFGRKLTPALASAPVASAPVQDTFGDFQAAPAEPVDFGAFQSGPFSAFQGPPAPAPMPSPLPAPVEPPRSLDDLINQSFAGAFGSGSAPPKAASPARADKPAAAPVAPATTERKAVDWSNVNIRSLLQQPVATPEPAPPVAEVSPFGAFVEPPALAAPIAALEPASSTASLPVAEEIAFGDFAAPSADVTFGDFAAPEPEVSFAAFSQPQAAFSQPQAAFPQPQPSIAAFPQPQPSIAPPKQPTASFLLGTGAAAPLKAVEPAFDAFAAVPPMATPSATSRLPPPPAEKPQRVQASAFAAFLKPTEAEVRMREVLAREEQKTVAAVKPEPPKAAIEPHAPAATALSPAEAVRRFVAAFQLEEASLLHAHETALAQAPALKARYLAAKEDDNLELALSIRRELQAAEKAQLDSARLQQLLASAARAPSAPETEPAIVRFSSELVALRNGDEVALEFARNYSVRALAQVAASDPVRAFALLREGEQAYSVLAQAHAAPDVNTLAAWDTVVSKATAELDALAALLDAHRATALGPQWTRDSRAQAYFAALARVYLVGMRCGVSLRTHRAGAKTESSVGALEGVWGRLIQRGMPLKAPRELASVSQHEPRCWVCGVHTNPTEAVAALDDAGAQHAHLVCANFFANRVTEQ